MYDWSQLPKNPFMALLKPFLDLLGNGFYLLPISVMGGALWLQKRDITIVMLYFTSAFIFLSGADIWAGYMPILPLYIFLAAAGLTSLIVQWLFIRR